MTARVRAEIVQSVFDFAIREINALEHRIVTAEDDADGMLWDQAQQIVAQLETGVTERALAAQWINARTQQPYSCVHVNFVRQVVAKFTKQVPRPPFREAYNRIANRGKASIHHSSESSEHYTPPAIIEAVVACLGRIDLDPCSNSGKTPNVPAKRHFTQKDDGLVQPWRGTVYMNPPYGRQIDAWTAKLCDEHEAGHVPAAIALVPARTDTAWFKRFRNYICCFVEGRLVFVGNEDPAPFPSAVFYLGEDVGKFHHHFAELGDIWQRIEPGMFGE